MALCLGPQTIHPPVLLAPLALPRARHALAFIVMSMLGQSVWTLKMLTRLSELFKSLLRFTAELT